MLRCEALSKSLQASLDLGICVLKDALGLSNCRQCVVDRLMTEGESASKRERQKNGRAATFVYEHERTLEEVTTPARSL